MASKLLETLSEDLAVSLKKGDSVRVETLRFLVAAVRNSAIAKYGHEADLKLTDEDVLEVVKKQVKTHQESVAAFTSGGRSDLADREKAQLIILESLLPAEVSDEELKRVLGPVVASGEQNFGLLMKQAMAAVGGRASGGRVAALLRQMTQIYD